MLLNAVNVVLFHVYYSIFNSCLSGADRISTQRHAGSEDGAKVFVESVTVYFMDSMVIIKESDS